MLTRQEPTERAVPPIELMKASSFLVSLRRRQQLLSTPTLSLAKKLESLHFMLCLDAQRAYSLSTKTSQFRVRIISSASSGVMSLRFSREYVSTGYVNIWYFSLISLTTSMYTFWHSSMSSIWSMARVPSGNSTPPKRDSI